MTSTWKAAIARNTAGPGAGSGGRAPAVRAVLADVARAAPMTAAMAGLEAPAHGTADGADGTPAGAVDGAVLADQDWLADQVRLSARRWRTSSIRVAGTLWWYSSSTVLLTPPAVTGLLTGRAVHPGPEGLLLRDEGQGRLTAVHPTRLLEGPAETALPEPLRQLTETCVGTLAAVTGMRPRPLWALAADSLANTLLRAGRETGRVQEATAFAERLAAAIGPPMPRLRWSDVPVPDGSDGLFPPPPASAAPVERFVRRGSCCLIYETEGEGKCASCPRRTPADRRLQLEIAASRLAALG